MNLVCFYDITKNDLVLPCGVYGRWEKNEA